MSDDSRIEIKPKPVYPNADPVNRVWGQWDDEEGMPPVMQVFDTVEEADAYIERRELPKKKK